MSSTPPDTAVTTAATVEEVERLLCGRRQSARSLLEEMGVIPAQGYLALPASHRPDVDVEDDAAPDAGVDGGFKAGRSDSGIGAGDVAGAIAEVKKGRETKRTLSGVLGGAKDLL